MLLMVEKGIRGGMCHTIHRYAKANNKHMKNDNKSKESSYVQYLDANDLYGWEMFQKLPVADFEWVEDILIINEKLKKVIKIIKNYDEESYIGHIFEVDFEYPKNLYDLYGDLPFLPERMKINKYSKCVCNLFDKKLRCSPKSFKTESTEILS